jgi:hypothetical protein
MLARNPLQLRHSRTIRPFEGGKESLMVLTRLAPVAFACLLAGCGSIGAIGLGPMNKNQPASQEMGGLPPTDPNQTAATGPVASEPLPDPGAGNQTAAAAPAPTSSNVSRTDLLGGWTIAASGDSCQLFMTRSCGERQRYTQGDRFRPPRWQSHSTTALDGR